MSPEAVVRVFVGVEADVVEVGAVVLFDVAEGAPSVGLFAYVEFVLIVVFALVVVETPVAIVGRLGYWLPPRQTP